MSDARDIQQEQRMSEQGEARLARLTGATLDSSGAAEAYTTEFVKWLEREVAAGASSTELRDAERAAARASAQLSKPLGAMRVGESIRRYPLQDVGADTVGSISEVARTAAARGCAPWAESFAVAAGVGRELWDEPCERWVELPAELSARSSLVALGVAGDSMTPYLVDGDVIVVDTRARVTRDSIVVARRSDGYVVKLVTRVTRHALELSSFNESYEPFEIEREPGVIVGVVLARLTRA